MASLNRVFLIGNLTKDPEIRYLPSGTPVGDLRLAVSRKYRTKQGEDKEETAFVSIAVFGAQAEPCGKYLRKGSPVLIEGRLRFEEWERDGQKNSRLSVIADRVQFLSSPRDSSYGDAPRDRAPDRREYRDAPAPASADRPDTGGSDSDRSGVEEDEDNIPF